jgi:hypothetical protein
MPQSPLGVGVDEAVAVSRGVAEGEAVRDAVGVIETVGLAVAVLV